MFFKNTLSFFLGIPLSIPISFSLIMAPEAKKLAREIGLLRLVIGGTDIQGKWR
jgi:hypothetical protein